MKLELVVQKHEHKSICSTVPKQMLSKQVYEILFY